MLNLLFHVGTARILRGIRRRSKIAHFQEHAAYLCDTAGRDAQRISILECLRRFSLQSCLEVACWFLGTSLLAKGEFNDNISLVPTSDT